MYYKLLNDLHEMHSPHLRNHYLAAISDGSDYQVEHCFEYLRQAVMCAADSNLEDADKMNVATGWGIRRTCRNYDALREWSEKWKNIYQNSL
jgi:hypothetical protein